MDAVTMLEHCLAKPGAWPDHPFDPVQPVVKVGSTEQAKIFAFVNADGVGLKCARSREVADAWLERHPGAATVMAYIGRHGWNDLGYAIPDDELLDAADESYRLVVTGLPRSRRPAGWEG